MNILITRQLPQAQQLSSMLIKKGYSPTTCPMLKIVSLLNIEKIKKLKSRLYKYELLIFTSPEAVKAIMPNLQQILMHKVAWAGIGDSTALELEKFGIKEVITPPQKPFNSESLLAHLKTCNFIHQTALIFTGKQGGLQLEQGLSQRNIDVELITCYQRELPARSNLYLANILNPNKPKIDLILITCETILYNLLASTTKLQKKLLFSIALLVASPRIKNKALALGWSNVFISTGASNQDMLASIINLSLMLNYENTTS